MGPKNKKNKFKKFTDSSVQEIEAKLKESPNAKKSQKTEGIHREENAVYETGLGNNQEGVSKTLNNIEQHCTRVVKTTYIQETATCWSTPSNINVLQSANIHTKCDSPSQSYEAESAYSEINDGKFKYTTL